MFKMIFRWLIALMMAVSFVTVLAVPIRALDARGGDMVTIPVGEVIEGDVYLAGRDIIIDGLINGDIFGAGQSLTINGNINGGITFAGQTIIINGDISNGARLAGQSIVINGNIGRDLIVAGNDLTMNSQSLTNGDLVLSVEKARVNGYLGGAVRGNAAEITIMDEVGKDIELKTDRLTITSSANIQGNLTYTSKREAVIQPGATIAGMISHEIPEKRVREWGFFPIIAGAVLWQALSFLMILIVGIILVLVAPRRLNSMASSIHTKPWQSLGWGVILLVVVPVVAIIVMITVIGLPLGLISLALYGIAIYLSQIPVGLLIGRLIIKQNRELKSKAQMVGAMALGLLILLLLTLIPFVGWAIALAVVAFGLGSLVTASRRLEVTA